jgi:hypothetical protein
MKSLAFCTFGIICGTLFSGLSLYLYEFKLHRDLELEKAEKASSFYILENSNYWEPVNASSFGAGKGNEWALMLMDGSWRALVITTYTPWERDGKKAYVHISTKFHAESGSSPGDLIEVNSEEEQKLIETLQSLHFSEHQEVFRNIVSEFLETLSDRSKFAYEPQEMEIRTSRADQ